MGAQTRATDWHTTCMVNGSASLPIGVGGAFFLLTFASEAADIRANFVFSGIGLGGGVGSMMGGSLAPTSLSPIECERPFSVDDLHDSAGRVTYLGAGLAIGYGFMYISAFNWSGDMFRSQPAHGWGGGTGVSGITTIGAWRRI